jgi:hypothetical protein
MACCYLEQRIFSRIFTPTKFSPQIYSVDTIFGVEFLLSDADILVLEPPLLYLTNMLASPVLRSQRFPAEPWSAFGPCKPERLALQKSLYRHEWMAGQNQLRQWHDDLVASSTLQHESHSTGFEDQSYSPLRLEPWSWSNFVHEQILDHQALQVQKPPYWSTVSDCMLRSMGLPTKRPGVMSVFRGAPPIRAITQPLKGWRGAPTSHITATALTIKQADILRLDRF